MFFFFNTIAAQTIDIYKSYLFIELKIVLMPIKNASPFVSSGVPNGSTNKLLHRILRPNGRFM